ncbi:MAG: FAD-dependent oxidoreductase [Fibrobacteria bacterium]|nr:FAD-dependent oxidoreductase [Fibrobacteria bacterium]
MNESQKKQIIVVGGVAGGASFAARMRRLDESAHITMYEKGSFISFANCGLPYHIGKTIKKRKKLLLQTPESFNSRYNVDVKVNTEVISVNTSESTVTVRENDQCETKAYDYLMLAPGCKPINPPIEGFNIPQVYTLRTINDMDHIKKAAKNKAAKCVAVIGGGFIGLEVAENLRDRGLDVMLIELADQVFIPADKEMARILHQHLKEKGIKLYLNNGACNCEKLKNNQLSLSLNSGASLNCDFIVMAVGVSPDTQFLNDSGISLNPRGAIITDNQMRTNIPNVYAAGDAVEVTEFVTNEKAQIPLAGPANRQGRIAADNIAGIDTSYKNTQGTAICKLFDLTAAVTGLNEKTAKRLNIEFNKSYTHSANHAGYYPGASTMAVKLLFSPTIGKLLGAQVIGKEGVDKRIDVFSTAIRQGLTIDDLTELELAYAPPYGSAKDAVNMAGFVAQNILDKLVVPFYVEDLPDINDTQQILLDVRTKKEIKKGMLQGALHIPIDDLRERLGELDDQKEIMVYCQVGMRGYLACRILTQNGFRCRNLSGGYTTYLQYEPV